MSGENRTSLAILVLALLSLVLAAAFSPQTEAEASAAGTSAVELVSPADNVATWMFRLAAWFPGSNPPAEHAECAAASYPAPNPVGTL